MSIPNVNVNIQDGALGLASDSSAQTQVVVGTSSAGTANQLTSVSAIGDLVTKFGQGPLVEAAARVLAVAGGPVLVMKVASDVAASAGSVTKNGTSSATLALTGSTPNDAYSLVVQIVQGGATLAAGTATMKVSLDGGTTYGAEVAIPTSGTYAIPNSGVTLTFTYTSGTAFVAGDTYSATTTGPGYTTSALNTTFTALLADPRTWFLVHIVGAATDLAGTRTLFAAVDSQMATAAANYRFARAVIEAPNGLTDSAILANTTGLGDLASTNGRTLIGAGYLNVISPISGYAYARNVAWEACAWASAIAPSEELGAVARGPLAGVVSLQRDEQATPGLDAGRFITARTIVGRQGFYITRGRTFAAAGSDYAYLTNGRVIDIASGVARDAALQFLNAKIPTKPDGTIADTAARGIESYIQGKLDDALTNKGDAVATAVAVDRTINLLSTGNLKMRVRVQPYGYASTITIDLGFTSPSIANAA